MADNNHITDSALRSSKRIRKLGFNAISNYSKMSKNSSTNLPEPFTAASSKRNSSKMSSKIVEPSIAIKDLKAPPETLGAIKKIIEAALPSYSEMEDGSYTKASDNDASEEESNEDSDEEAENGENESDRNLSLGESEHSANEDDGSDAKGCVETTTRTYTERQLKSVVTLEGAMRKKHKSALLESMIQTLIKESTSPAVAQIIGRGREMDHVLELACDNFVSGCKKKTGTFSTTNGTHFEISLPRTIRNNSVKFTAPLRKLIAGKLEVIPHCYVIPDSVHPNKLVSEYAQIAIQCPCCTTDDYPHMFITKGQLVSDVMRSMDIISMSEQNILNAFIWMAKTQVTHPTTKKVSFPFRLSSSRVTTLSQSVYTHCVRMQRDGHENHVNVPAVCGRYQLTLKNLVLRDGKKLSEAQS